jgi:hypothetical protein
MSWSWSSNPIPSVPFLWIDQMQKRLWNNVSLKVILVRKPINIYAVKILSDEPV